MFKFANLTNLSVRALFIGRFQPVHLGHLAAIQNILQTANEIIILVAAGQLSHTLKNPLTAGERIHLIREAVIEANYDLKKLWIIPAQDVSDNALWVPHIQRLAPPFDIMYTNNPFTRRLFEEAKVKTEKTELVNRVNYSATLIRNLIIEGKDLSKHLMSSTIKKLEKWDIRGRFSSIISDDTATSTIFSGSEMNVGT